MLKFSCNEQWKKYRFKKKTQKFIWFILKIKIRNYLIKILQYITMFIFKKQKLRINIFSGHSAKISTYEDIEKFRIQCDASGVLLARSALFHPSIFCSKGGILSMRCEIENFLDKVIFFIKIKINIKKVQCIEYDECFTGTKYGMQRLLGNAQASLHKIFVLYNIVIIVFN